MSDHGHHGHHIVPLKILFTVFGALVFLTVLTVLTAKFLDLGVFNLPLALVIAGTKAMLVVTIFMALKYDNRVNTLVLAIGGIFVVVFLVFTLFDTAFRGDLTNVESMPISDIEARDAELEERSNQIDPEALKVAPADYE